MGNGQKGLELIYSFILVNNGAVSLRKGDELKTLYSEGQFCYHRMGMGLRTPDASFQDIVFEFFWDFKE